MQDYEAQNRGQQSAVNFAEMILQQSVRVIEMQNALAHAAFRTQARGVAALGGPDWSALYTDETQRRFSELLKTSADHVVSLVRQTNDAVLEFQNAFSQALSRQTAELTTQVRRTVEETGTQIEQGVASTRMTAQQAADVVQQAADVVQQAAGGLEGGSRAKRHA